METCILEVTLIATMRARYCARSAPSAVSVGAFSSGLAFPHAIVQGRAVYLCTGNSSVTPMTMRAALSGCESPPCDVSLPYPGLQVVSMDEGWMIDSGRCADPPMRAVQAQSLGHLHLLERYPVIWHWMRSTNIAHYYYESFHNCYAHLDGALGWGHCSTFQWRRKVAARAPVLGCFSGAV
jgi:hypothetical protein